MIETTESDLVKLEAGLGDGWVHADLDSLDTVLARMEAARYRAEHREDDPE